MVIPSQLIVVGMRFHPHYSKSKLTVNDRVVIVKEPSNKTNRNAVAVHFLENGESLHVGNRIGYIRDADLSQLPTKDFNYHGNIDLYKYSTMFKITRICTNYLRIDPVEGITTVKPSGTASVLSGVSSGIHNTGASNMYIRNPCAEIPLHMKVYQTALDGSFLTNTKPQIKEKPKMINTNSMRDSFFKEVKNVALDMQSGKLGIVTKDGITVFTDEGVSVNPITEMGFNIPAFAMRVPVEQLAKGDIIIGSGEPVFFREGSKAGYLTISTTGVFQEVGIVANMFFGKNTVMAVKNMFGGDSSESGMNPMMLAMMMGSDKEGSGGFDFKKMMMMQMMMGQGNQGGIGGMNPMMAMMFMDKM